MPALLAYRDGKYLPKDEITIHLDDLGYERGFAVFDYCRVRNNRVPFILDHLERLDHSQSLLRLNTPVEMQLVKEIIENLLLKNNLSDSYFKIMISGRLSENNISPILMVYQDPYKAYDDAMYKHGVSLILEEYAKPFPEYKTTFYLGALKEYSRMMQSKSEDVLFYADDIIRETSRCNIFMMKNGLIFTPDKNMLKGVTRKHVMKCALEKFMVIEKDISVKELLEADEVFISSTTKNIMPVVKIEDAAIANGIPGEITTELIESFNHYCNNYGTD